MSVTISPSLISRMIGKAIDSPINFKLAAVLLKNKKPIGPILYNTDRIYSRGKVCSSVHAEANVLLNHFGSNLKFCGCKWRVLREREKGFQQIQSPCNSSKPPWWTCKCSSLS